MSTAAGRPREGSRLGPYEIVARVGAGGMGEVYRARDPRLGRDVALKILAGDVGVDSQRLRRFEREARAVSVLSHPNIVTVYEIGESDAVSYIAMELVEGQTLRQLLRAGGLPVRRVLDLATQIAEGLARAHEAGVVHRDLKPDNVMVTPSGVVKILDFGLAKLTRSFLERGAEPEDATLPLPTEPGVLLGTVRYMSPEQAGGLAADYRSDQFAFGSLVYEMATGESAFQKGTTVDTLSAILHDEPAPIGQRNPRVPVPLRWIVERCLAKDPKGRYASTEDLARDLAAVRSHLSEVSGPGELPSPLAVRGRRGWLLAGVAALFLGVAAGTLLLRRGLAGDPPLFRQLTFRTGAVGSARFAPDGETIVFSAEWQRAPAELFVQRLDSPESRSLGISGAHVLSISRSGEIALRRDPSHTLARVGMLNAGAPREVLEGVTGADWSPDGRELAIVHEVGGRSAIEYPIGTVLYRESAGYVSAIRVSRDGERVAFLDHPVQAEMGGNVSVVDRAGRVRVLAKGFNLVWGLAWSPDGKEVWFTAAPTGDDQALFAVTLDGRQRLVSRVMGSMQVHDVAPSGRVLMTHWNSTDHVMVRPPGEQRERDLTWLDMSLSRAISNDGREVLILESGEGGGPGNSVFLRRSDGSPAVRLGEGAPWSLSPDGKLAAALVERSGTNFLVLYPTGPGEARTIPLPGLEPQAADFLPDGRRLVLTAGRAGGAPRIYQVDTDGGAARAVSPDGYRAFEGTVSPDGRVVVARGPDRRIVLFPVEGGAPIPVPGLTESDVPRGWSADLRHVYVTGNVYTVPRRVERVDVVTGRRELWKELGPETGAVGIHVTPDGRAYVYSFVSGQADLYLVEGLR